jgi:isoleucyl-tRNA synthetase
MKEAAAKIEALSQIEIQSLLKGEALLIETGTRRVSVTADKLDIRRNEKANLRILNEGTLTVGLDTEITRELSLEGDIRDLIRGVQNARKEMGLEVTDRIKLSVYGGEKLKEAWDALNSSASEETLAVEFAWAEGGKISIDAGEETWLVHIEKVGNN